jgi:hypothetical protein
MNPLEFPNADKLIEAVRVRDTGVLLIVMMGPDCWRTPVSLRRDGCLTCGQGWPGSTSVPLS